MKFFRFKLVLCIFLVSFPIWGEDPNFINSPDIPRMSEVLKEWGNLPHQNPYFGNAAHGLSQFNWKQFAQMIAHFEKHLPGVHYATLGRDASLAGWMLDAFYTQIGQPDRVTYLRGSGVTIRNQGARLAEFLEDAGMDLNPKNIHKQAPWVIVDSIGSGVNSQVGQIVKAGVNEYVRRGGKLKDIEKKLMGFGIDSNFPDKIESAAFSPGANPYLFSSNLPIPRNGEWHGGYGALIKHHDGLYGAPSGLNNLAIRRSLMGSLYEIIKETRDPQFLKWVQAEAKNIGYVFPAKGITYAPPAPPKPRTEKDIENELSQVVKGFGAKDKAQHGLSTNGRALSQWLQSSVIQDGNKAILALLPVLHDAKKAQQIGTQDIRSLIGQAIRDANIDAAFIKALDKVIKDHSRVRNVFKEEYRFLQKDPAIKANYQALMQQVPSLSSCHQALIQAGKI